MPRWLEALRCLANMLLSLFLVAALGGAWYDGLYVSAAALVPLAVWFARRFWCYRTPRASPLPRNGDGPADG